MKRQHELLLGGFAILVITLSWTASWVGLSGTWVGDDWHMVHNYLYADWAELGAVFKRNAASYLFVEDKVGPYRPTTMLTLIATHLLAPEPWLHHAVSWLLHAATSLLLFLVLRVPPPAASNVDHATNDFVAAGLAALFFLHPVHVESYVWINGRSDLLAGFWLVALVFWLTQSSAALRPGWVQLLVLGLVAFLGASSKLPFAIAALATWLAWASRTFSVQSRRAGSAIALGIAVHLVLRTVFAPFRGQLGASENVFADPEIWSSVPKLVGKGAVTLLSIRAEAMQSLSGVLFGPWSASDWIGLAIALFGLGFLISRRDWSGLAYAVGAVATLAPVAMVSGAFWMGFDRYLYMPTILALLAMSPYVVHAASQSRGWRNALGVLGLGLLGYSAIQTHAASQAYAGQEAFDRALLRDHADDSSIHFYFARIAARHDDERKLRDQLSAMPSPPWPRPIIAPTYDLAIQANDAAKRREAVDALVATARDGSRCVRIRTQLESWAETDVDPETARYISERLAALSCGP